MSIEAPQASFTHPGHINAQDAILVIGAAIFTSLVTEGMNSNNKRCV
jgi:hypothetical protein